MLYGLYLSAQGAQAQSLRQDVIANNLANAGTSAFKRDFAVLIEPKPPEPGPGLPDPGRAARPPGGALLATATDFSQAPLQSTGRELDLALSGPGFLTVTDGERQFLTRDGRLAVDANGFLILRDSRLKLLNAAGEPIAVDPTGGPLQIAADGTISQANVEIGRLAIAMPQRLEDLTKVGENLFVSRGPVGAAGEETKLHQGFVEASGTKPVTEMLEMIQTERAYEANLNLLRMQDESLERLLRL